eukprot:s8531_g5.t1
MTVSACTTLCWALQLSRHLNFINFMAKGTRAVAATRGLVWRAKSMRSFCALPEVLPFLICLFDEDVAEEAAKSEHFEVKVPAAAPAVPGPSPANMGDAKVPSHLSTKQVDPFSLSQSRSDDLAHVYICP